jgi:hypothetical protein
VITPVSPALGRLRPRLLPRRFHAYALGTVKSGTHSWFGLFARRYRAFHEMEPRRLVRFAIEVERGEHSSAAIDAFLRTRDRRFRPELHASHVDAVFVDRLAALFPEARFLISTRSPASWLDSWINHELGAQPRPHEWNRWREITFPRSQGHHPPEEALLADLGLAPLGCYLGYWSRHHDRILGAVERDRLLVVPTRDLRDRVSEIAGFLGVRAHTLDPSHGHAYATPTRQRFGLLEYLPADHLRRQIQEHCGRTVARLVAASRDPALAERLAEPATPSREVGRDDATTP